MECKGFVFDLDGTLADTIEDIAAAMNASLAALGEPQLLVANYRALVGGGIMALARAVLSESSRTEDRARTLKNDMMTRYAQAPVERTRIYPGVSDLLVALSARACPLAVLSNKPDALVKAIVASLFPTVCFIRAQGDLDGIARKPDPTAALGIASAMGLKPGDIAFVGDSDVDMKTACGAGMLAVGVSWGYRSADELKQAGADLIVDRPGQIIELSGRAR